MTATTALAVLFTDLVGSTELSVALAPDDAENLRRSHLAVLRAAVASTGGEEVKTLGDGLMVVFRSPSRALACAAAMQRGIDRHNRRAGPPLAVRIGVSGGEVTEEDGDYFGDPVVEAARLCALAEGGQILVSATARWMAGRQAPVELVDVGERALKGLPDPVATFEVRWHTGEPGDGQVPLPARLTAAAVDVFPFTGRAGELAALATW
jgi:class 3 adenylate cyclase